MGKRGDLFIQTENRYAGYTVYDDAGEKIGKVDVVFVDENDDTEYVAAKIGSLEPRYMLIPIDEARVDEQLLKISVSRERVKDTLDGEMAPEFEWPVWSFSGVVRDGVLEMPCADWIVPAILVCLREQGFYGHALMRSVIDVGPGATHPAAVYRTLQQLEQEGLVVSEPLWFDGRLSRRSYSVTESGESFLEYLANALAQYRKEIDLFFRLYNKQSHQGTAIETQRPLV